MKQELVDLLAGAAAGVTADALMHPVDTVRTRLWIQGAKGTHGYKYRGVVSAVASIVRTEGVLALYKGLGVVAMMTSVGSGVYFATYEFCKRIKVGGGGAIADSRQHFAAGLTANAVGGLVWTPMDVVKQRQQAAVENPFRNPLHGLWVVYKEGGLRNGIFRGYWAGFATYGPFSAIYFTIYEKWKSTMARVQGLQVEALGSREHLSGGFVAGGTAAVLTAPVDAVKTRKQVGESGSIFRLAIRLFKQEGVTVFTKGMGARLLWIAPGCSLTIAGFEFFKRFLEGLDSAGH